MFFLPSKARRALAADQLIGLIDDAIVITDRDHNIVRFNTAAEKLFGWRASEVVGQPLDVLMPERFHLQHGMQMDEFAQGPLPVRQMQNRARQIYGQRKDGTEFIASVQIMRLGKGSAMQMAAVVRDISREQKNEEEVLRLAAVDPLTGAYNKRELAAMSEREALRAARYHHPLSILLLDLDDFRQINDAFGTQLGDAVLQTFADMCAHTLRSVDVLGRWSDKEFVILLPETPLDGAQIIADRLRRQTAVLKFGTAADVKVTVSIGITQYRDSEIAIEAPLARADSALMDAKRGGRNRIAVCRA